MVNYIEYTVHFCYLYNGEPHFDTCEIKLGKGIVAYKHLNFVTEAVYQIRAELRSCGITLTGVVKSSSFKKSQSKLKKKYLKALKGLSR